METNKPKKVRKTLIQLASESNVRDPAAHAKHCVSELDKTAKRTALMRKHCEEAILEDSKQIQLIEEQIARINERYIPLCEHVKDAERVKASLIETLKKSVAEEREIMTNIKGTVQTRIIDEAKFQRKMATSELQSLRGFSMSPESTFHQGRSHNAGSVVLPPLSK